MDIRERLNTLSKQQLVQLTADCNGGRVGFDHARVSKSDMIERLLLAHAETAISSVLETARYLDTPERPVLAAAPTGDAAAALAAAVQALAAQVAPASASLDVEAVERIVDARLAAAPGVRIELVRGDGSTYVAPHGSRPEFARILRRAAAGLNIMLVGPAGCGKTTIAKQVSEALARPFASVSCTAGMSESALQGWLIPGEGGAFEYLPSDFVRMYEQGGVFLLDEMDAADPNTLLFINQALANGGFNLPMRKGATRVERHPDFVCIAACNTFGTGANMTYSGRERLDEATLDRFRAGMVVLEYDAALEQATVDARLLEWGRKVRAGIAASRLQRVMSTRFLLDGTRALRAGDSLEEVQSTYFIGWKDDERRKVEA